MLKLELIIEETPTGVTCEISQWSINPVSINEETAANEIIAAIQNNAPKEEPTPIQ